MVQVHPAGPKQTMSGFQPPKPKRYINRLENNRTGKAIWLLPHALPGQHIVTAWETSSDTILLFKIRKIMGFSEKDGYFYVDIEGRGPTKFNPHEYVILIPEYQENGPE